MANRLQVPRAQLGRVIEIHDGFLVIRVLARHKEDRMMLDELRILTMEYLI